jgi:hypothetical protein
MKVSDGSLFTTLLLFGFIGVFGYDLIIFTWGIENQIIGLVWLAVTLVVTGYASIDWSRKHPEIYRVDHA